MKKTMQTGLIFLLSCFLLSVAYLPEQARAKEVFKMRLAFAGGPQSFSARAHKWWAEEIERRTDGRVQIQLFWGGALASHREMVKLIGEGAIDMGESVWAPYNPQIFPLHTVTEMSVWRKMPMALVYAGMQIEREFPEVEAENTNANMKRLTWQGAGIANLMMKDKPIRQLKDLRGLQIRTAGRFLNPPLVKAVGAVPVGIPMPALYDSLQKGMIAGATGTSGLFLGQKLHEICKYQIKIGMGGDPGQGIMINLDLWNRLPEDIQAIFMNMYEKDFPKVFLEQFAMPDYERSKAVFEEAGVETIELSEAERNKWKAKMPLEKIAGPWIKMASKSSGLSKERIREIMNRYLELVDEYEKTHTSVW